MLPNVFESPEGGHYKGYDPFDSQRLLSNLELMQLRPTIRRASVAITRPVLADVKGSHVPSFLTRHCADAVLKSERTSGTSSPAKPSLAKSRFSLKKSKEGKHPVSESSGDEIPPATLNATPHTSTQSYPTFQEHENDRKVAKPLPSGTMMATHGTTGARRHVVLNIGRRIVWYEEDQERSTDEVICSEMKAEPTAHDINHTTCDSTRLEVGASLPACRDHIGRHWLQQR